MNKYVRGALFSAVALVLLLGTFSGGFLVGHFVPTSGQIPFLSGGAQPTTDTQPGLPPGHPPVTSSPGTDVNTLFQPFWEAWTIVHNQYVDQPVDDVALMQGAISGMMNALGDAHSSYMDPQLFQAENDSLAGQYEGIGAWVDTTGDYLTIISPMADSPAEKAGLMPGDQIIAIDGEDMTGHTPEEARQKVLGPAGSTVTLTVTREGVSEPLQFTLQRGKIVVKSVTGKMLDNSIGYVEISTFGDKTSDELRSTLTDLMVQNPKGLIIDLRNNGGGYLQTAIDVASEFIGNGVILYEQYGDGTRNTFDAQKGGLATNIPLVVLINEGTASASEIVSGAIQDYGRGKLVGVTSYGKGSVQNWVPLTNNQGAIRVTIARWLTPKERTIDKIGLTPDVEVEMTPDDIKAGRDPQLDKGVEVLQNMINGSASN